MGGLRHGWSRIVARRPQLTVLPFVVLLGFVLPGRVRLLVGAVADHGWSMGVAGLVGVAVAVASTGAVLLAYRRSGPAAVPQRRWLWRSAFGWAGLLLVAGVATGPARLPDADAGLDSVFEAAAVGLVVMDLGVVLVGLVAVVLIMPIGGHRDRAGWRCGSRKR